MLVSISVVAYAQATTGSDVMTKRKLNPTQKSTQTKNNPTPQTGNKNTTNVQTKTYNAGTQPINKNNVDKTKIDDPEHGKIVAWGMWTALPVERWGLLRTTNEPGIYQLIRSCTNGNPNVMYFYYNKREKRMKQVTVYVQNNNKTIELVRAHKNAFTRDGNKSNSFTHNGKLYTIQKPVTPICNNIPKHQEIVFRKTLDVEELVTKLHTTRVPGVYAEYSPLYYEHLSPCKCAKYEEMRFYFYNTKIKKMVLIPTIHETPMIDKDRKNRDINGLTPLLYSPINSTKDLGDLEEEYKLYGNKTDTITHNGKVYKIQPPCTETPDKRTKLPTKQIK